MAAAGPGQTWTYDRPSDWQEVVDAFTLFLKTYGKGQSAAAMQQDGDAGAEAEDGGQDEPLYVTQLKQMEAHDARTMEVGGCQFAGPRVGRGGTPAGPPDRGGTGSFGTKVKK